jgi:aspartyl-tRNA(Asn)/glutamyl-tRNA(Gln) amidotransferase subunit A
MEALNKTSARKLALAVAHGRVSALEVVNAHLQALRNWEPRIAAFLRVNDSEALAQAERIDAKRAQGLVLGPLAGVPVAVKDIFCTAGLQTTCASRVLENFVPPYDAEAVGRIRSADAIIIGKTNMDEFAMGSSTENSAFQVTRNPWDLERTPGGSSGGSAAAVAAGEVPLALGSDTGGSIRQPASLCGIVGIKPTYGRVSRFGLIAFASSLDQAGPLARTVEDAALFLGVIAGHDPHDSTSASVAAPDYLEGLEQPWQPLTIGIAPEYFGAGLDPEVENNVRQALEVYKNLGARISEISLPHSAFAVAVYYLVATAEASSNLARYDGVRYGYRSSNFENLEGMYRATRGGAFGAEVKRRIMLGTYALSSGYKDAYYVRALRVRRLIKEDFDRAFGNCDVIMGPTSPTAAFRLGERIENPLAMYLSDIYTLGANLAGIPGISVPCGFTKSGLPVGLQILAPAFEESRLLRVARMYEREMNWHTRWPA